MSDNISTASIDVAKIEDARRKEYEKIKQVNKMYLSAKDLGFPDKLALGLDHECYRIIVSVPNCFNTRYIKGETPCSFIRLTLTRVDIDEMLTRENNEGDIPNFVLWLLVCMKLFYKKDWDGRKWKDERAPFERYEDTYVVEKFPWQFEQEYPSPHDLVMKELAEKMAKDIDHEIMQAMKSDPDHWHVQVGNTIYGKYEGR